MNKNLQDLAWSVLPKEFKEEVKKEYRKWFNEPWWGSGYLRGRLRILRELFGEHNLTSDAEGEVELLHVTRQKVMGLYANAKKLHDLYTSATCINETESRTIDRTDGTMWVLKNLFGSKCLPDDKADEKVDDKADENVPYENPSDIDSSEPNPAEPKFKMGDKVRYVGDIQPTYKGKVFVIDGEVFSNNYYNEWQTRSIKPFAWDGLSVCNVPLTDLEPYTEPDTSHETPVCENHSDDTSQKEANMNSNRNLSHNIADCDKQLDNILKDSFRNERRLNIAAMAMHGILSNSMIMERFFRIDKDSDKVARCALAHADALIAECEKGGSK